MKMKVFLLLLANVFAALVLLYFLDMFGVSSLYSDLKKQVVPLGGPVAKTVSSDEDPWLIEKQEQQKLMESFDLREVDLKEKEKELEEKKTEIIEETAKLASARQKLADQKKEFERQKNEQSSYEQEVKKLAVKYNGMPPESSVAMIVKLGDDLLILDVLEQMDVYAEEQGRSSMVPYLYTLMEPETAARLQRKSTVSK